MHKHPKMDKYFLKDESCNCLGFKKWEKCKHLNMINGVWTPCEGTPEWYEFELSGILGPKMDLPAFFNTAIIPIECESDYHKVCFTVQYKVKRKKYSMGVEIINTRVYDPVRFREIIEWRPVDTQYG